MSISLALLLRKGYMHGAQEGGQINITGDQDDYLPVSVAEWARKSHFNLTFTADRIVTGFDSDPVKNPTSPPGAGNLHPYATKTFVVDNNDTELGLLLRHLTTSASGNQLQCPQDVDLLLTHGDSFTMAWQNPRWIIVDLGRGPAIELTPAQITADDTIGYNPAGWRVADTVYLDTDAAYNIHGFEEDATASLGAASWLSHKKKKRVWNVGSFNITLTNENSTETSATSRMRTFSGASVVVAPNNYVDFDYDTAISRWRVG